VCASWRTGYLHLVCELKDFHHRSSVKMRVQGASTNTKVQALIPELLLLVALHVVVSSFYFLHLYIMYFLYLSDGMIFFSCLAATGDDASRIRYRRFVALAFAFSSFKVQKLERK